MRYENFGCASSVVIVLGLAFLLAPFTTSASSESSGWGIPIPISTNGVSEAFASGVAIDTDGNAIAVWSERNGTQYDVWANRFAPIWGWGIAEQIGAGAPGDGPHVAMASSGTAVAVWSGNGSIWAGYWRRADEGGGLGGVSSIRGRMGFAENPQLAMDPYGRVLVVWRELEGNRSSIWAAWFVPREGWRELASLGEGSAYFPRLPQVAVSEVGTAVIIWDGPGGALMATSFVPAGGWSVPVRIDVNGCPDDPRLAMSPAGTGFVVWQEWQWAGCTPGTDGPLWARSFTVAGGWSSPASGPENGEVPDIAVDRDGNATVVYWGSWQTGEGVWASPLAADAGWGSPTLLADAKMPYVEAYHEARPRVSSNRLGRALAVWNDGSRVINDPVHEIHLMASSFAPGVGWGEPSSIGPVRCCFQSDVALDPSGNAIVVWTVAELTATGLRSNIWANRYLRDLDSTPPMVDPGLSNEGLARLTSLVLGLFGFLVASVAVFAFLLFRSSVRGKSGDGLRLANRTALPREHSASLASLLLQRRGRQGESGALPTNPLGNHPAAVRRGNEHPPVVASMRLTTKERILLHLVRYARYAEDLEVPTDLTQEGIATAAWIDQRHFAQYIGPLERDGLVRERTAHVLNGHHRRRIYELTDSGRQVALRLVARAKSEVVRVWDGENVWEIRVGDIMDKLKGKVSVLDVARHLAEAGVVDFAALEANQHNSSVEAGDSDTSGHSGS